LPRRFDPLEILQSGRRIRTGTAAGGTRRIRMLAAEVKII
jgi:hypothetical protein